MTHPELPPLADVLTNGDTLLIDNTNLEEMTTCGRRFEYSKIRSRRAVAEKPALRYGSVIHLALEDRYKNPDFIASLDEPKQVEHMVNFMATNPCPDEEWRNVNSAVEAIRKFNRQPDSNETMTLPNGKPAVELPFAHLLGKFRNPLGSPEWINVVYTGRIDRWVKRGEMTFTLDHKTTSQLGPGFNEQQKMNSQHLGYMWALWKSLGVKCNGYIINAICTRKPTKTGNQHELAEYTYYKSWDLVDEWYDNMIHLIHRILFHYAHGYFPMETVWCVWKYGRCPFLDVCELPPKDRLLMLNSNLYKENKWSPLNERE